MTVIESSKKIIYDFKKSCFSAVAWAVSGLMRVEEITIVKVFRKLEKDDFVLWSWKKWQTGDWGSNIFCSLATERRGGWISLASLVRMANTPAAISLLSAIRQYGQ